MDPLSAAIVNASVSSAQQQLADEVQIAVLKKAMALEANAAMALVQALPPPMPTGAVVGSLLDVYA